MISPNPGTIAFIPAHFTFKHLYVENLGALFPDNLRMFVALFPGIIYVYM